MSSRPAGWYPDPWNPSAVRYWSGDDWTPHAAAPQWIEPRSPHPSLPFAVAWGAIVATVVPLVASRFVLRAVAQFRWPIAVYVLLLAVLAYGPPLVFLRYASRKWGTGRLRNDIGLTVAKADVGWGPLTWLGCLAAQFIVGVIVIVTKLPMQNNTDQIRAARDNPAYVIPILIVAVVAAPIVEEIVFRGMVLRGLLSRMQPKWAIAAQAVLFGCAHFDPSRGAGNVGLIVVLSGVGAVLGVAVHQFRRLGPSIIAHAILNGVAMAVVLSGWMPTGQ